MCAALLETRQLQVTRTASCGVKPVQLAAVGDSGWAWAAGGRRPGREGSLQACGLAFKLDPIFEFYLRRREVCTPASDNGGHAEAEGGRQEGRRHRAGCRRQDRCRGAPCGVFTLEAVTSCPRVPAEDARAWEQGGGQSRGKASDPAVGWRPPSGHPDPEWVARHQGRSTAIQGSPSSQQRAKATHSQELGSLAGHVQRDLPGSTGVWGGLRSGPPHFPISLLC